MEADCKGTTRIVVGYEPGIPEIELGHRTRIARVLESAFPKPCYEIVLETFERVDLAQSVLKGQVDVGVAGIVSAEVYARKELNSMGQLELNGLETVLLTPASFSVVSIEKESALDPQIAQNWSPWLVTPIGALGGVLALIGCVFLLNLRLPRLDRYFERATRRLDPRLSGFRRTLEWVYGSTSGRVFSLLWAALGAAIALVLVLPLRVTSQLAERKAQVAAVLSGVTADEDADAERAAPASSLREGAVKAAYPGRHVYELRSGRWMKCVRPFECLRNYADGKTKALAGDRDLLCRYARETQAARLEFTPQIAVPTMYALLLRSEHDVVAEHGATHRVLEALRDENYSSASPWSGCDDDSTASAAPSSHVR